MSIEQTLREALRVLEHIRNTHWTHWNNADADMTGKAIGSIRTALAAPAAAELTGVKLFKTTVLGVGPYCVEFPDGEIVYTRSEARQQAIALAAAPQPAEPVAFFCPACFVEVTQEQRDALVVAAPAATVPKDKK